MKWLLVALFVARVSIPMGLKITVENVKTFWADKGRYHLTLTDGRTIDVPVMWTVITEEK